MKASPPIHCLCRAANRCSTTTVRDDSTRLVRAGGQRSITGRFILSPPGSSRPARSAESSRSDQKKHDESYARRCPRPDLRGERSLFSWSRGSKPTRKGDEAGRGIGVRGNFSEKVSCYCQSPCRPSPFIPLCQEPDQHSTPELGRTHESVEVRGYLPPHPRCRSSTPWD